jgi:aspartate oxidase
LHKEKKMTEYLIIGADAAGLSAAVQIKCSQQQASIQSKTSGMNASELAWFDFAYAPPYAPVWNALLSSALKAAKI